MAIQGVALTKFQFKVQINNISECSTVFEKEPKGIPQIHLCSVEWQKGQEGMWLEEVALMKFYN
jgi:hypothetical protein